MANFGMDIAAVELAADDNKFTPVHPGKYYMQIVDSDVQPNSKGTGSWVKFEIDLIEPNAGRKIWQRINFEHTTPAVQNRGQRELKVIQQIFNLQEFTDSNLVHDKPFYAYVRIEKGKDGYEDSNKIDFDKTAKELLAPTQTGAAAPVTAAPDTSPDAGAAPSSETQPGSGPPPWQRPGAS